LTGSFCDLNYFSNVHRGRVSPARFNLVGNRGCSWKSGDNVAVTVGYKVAAAGRKEAKIYKLSTSNLIARHLDMIVKKESA